MYEQLIIIKYAVIDTASFSSSLVFSSFLLVLSSQTSRTYVLSGSGSLMVEFRENLSTRKKDSQEQNPHHQYLSQKKKMRHYLLSGDWN